MLHIVHIAHMIDKEGLDLGLQADYTGYIGGVRHCGHYPESRVADSGNQVYDTQALN